MKIRLEKVEFQQGDFRLQVDMEFQEKKLTTLLGPSGSGKTTLLRLLAGFHHPKQGSIQIGDKDITGLPPYKRRLSYLFQDLALFPHMSVKENLLFGLKMQGATYEECQERSDDLLNKLHLQGFEERRIHQLSGGEKQRVALGRALAPQPLGLLLDEPLSALDKTIRLKLGKEIRQIRQQTQLTTILVTHDQEEALNLSDWIYVMKDGLVIEGGSPKDLYHQPKNSWTAQFLGNGLLLPILQQDSKHVLTPWGSFPKEEFKQVQHMLIRPEWFQPGKSNARIQASFKSGYLGQGGYKYEMEYNEVIFPFNSPVSLKKGEPCPLDITRYHLI